jgi:cysteine desulfurase/selenocysteine lyase
MPQEVIDVITRFNTCERANAGRASYPMSTKLTGRIEEARVHVAGFIGAESEDIAFTSGATESLNTVALAWGLANLKSGDEIIVCPGDHSSIVLPWFNLQRILLSFGVEIKIVTIRIHPSHGDYELSDVRQAVNGKTRLIAISHVHHLYGMDMQAEEIREIVGNDVLISLDASDSIGHREVNVQELPVDFLSFSGHKMFAANGVGILWVSPKLRSTLRPLIVGGGMKLQGDLSDLRFSDRTLAGILEAGTQDIPAILSMVPAIDFIESIGIEAIKRRNQELMRDLFRGLRNLPGIDFGPGVAACSWQNSYGIICFRFRQTNTADIVCLLDSENILTRGDEHCIASAGEGDALLRVSVHVYNTEAEVLRLLDVLRSNLPAV